MTSHLRQVRYTTSGRPELHVCLSKETEHWKAGCPRDCDSDADRPNRRRASRLASATGRRSSSLSSRSDRRSLVAWASSSSRGGGVRAPPRASTRRHLRQGRDLHRSKRRCASPSSEARPAQGLVGSQRQRELVQRVASACGLDALLELPRGLVERCSCRYAYPRTRWTRARNAGGWSASLRELGQLRLAKGRFGSPARTAASAIRACTSCSKLAAWISRKPSTASFNSSSASSKRPALAAARPRLRRLIIDRKPYPVASTISCTARKSSSASRSAPGRTGSRRCCSSPSRRS